MFGRCFFCCLAVAASASDKLRPPTLTRLATGATKPTGWLLDELALQAQGLSGALPYFWFGTNL